MSGWPCLTWSPFDHLVLSLDSQCWEGGREGGGGGGTTVKWPLTEGSLPGPQNRSRWSRRSWLSCGRCWTPVTWTVLLPKRWAGCLDPGPETHLSLGSFSACFPASLSHSPVPDFSSVQMGQGTQRLHGGPSSLAFSSLPPTPPPPL